ncbi:hypothetical protein SAMN02787118_12924 [Streptomyces mirabilis]|uniref:Uncharacterized protein n=1 Tax=Streptomyces mirabilis TaxID=68239 RepID=A0A1I2URX9_9ACTN|nr:hypothetical protein SAMN02787118_12924 [Streptomyces mirabilis]
MLEERSGAGSTPASFTISHTVEAATFTPRTSGSPWTRRYAQLGFSRARRNTRARTGRTVRGRPGRFGLDACACRRLTRSRCQCSTVSGRTSSRHLRTTFRGSRYSTAAGNARSARSEPRLVCAELALLHRDLMAQGEDLGVLVPIAHRQQAQRGQRVHHAQAGQLQQHGRSSGRVDRQPRENADSSGLGRHPRHPTHSLPPGRMRLSARATFRLDVDKRIDLLPVPLPSLRRAALSASDGRSR